jgi:hypothetical protein
VSRADEVELGLSSPFHDGIWNVASSAVSTRSGHVGRGLIHPGNSLNHRRRLAGKEVHESRCLLNGLVVRTRTMHDRYAAALMGPSDHLNA